MNISIIIPVLNDKNRLLNLLDQLRPCVYLGHEVLVIDGGSDDGIADVKFQAGVNLIHTERGRALQMNAGAQHANGEILWFLHADSVFLQPIQAYLDAIMDLGNRHWGRFDVCLSGNRRIYRVIEKMMNGRSRLTRVCTGDQGIFVRKATFERLNGYAQIPIMEDIELSKRMKAISAPMNVAIALQASSRRWEERGVWPTIFLMWKMRLLYFIGVDTRKLARLYQGG